MMERYSRQIELISEVGQQKLLNASVLVIGSGGLGSPAIQAIAAAGVLNISIIDADVVELSNLNRQILHGNNTLGIKKVSSAALRLKDFNKDLKVTTYSAYLDEKKALDLFPNYDCIIDCVDNYETRTVVSKIATQLDIPLVEGGIEGYYGYVQVIIPGKTACFNCLSISAKSDNIYRQVLGASTGIVGNIQGLECIKILLGTFDYSYSYIAIDLESYDIQPLLLEAKESCTCHP